MISHFASAVATVNALLQNIKCSECGEQELSVDFSDAIGLSSNSTLCTEDTKCIILGECEFWGRA